MEKIIDTHRLTIQQQQTRIRRLLNDNFKLEHKLRLDNEQCEERVLLLQRELLSVQKLNQDLQIFEKEFKQSTDKIAELNHVIDRVTNKNNHLKTTLSRQTDDIHGLKKNVHGLEIDNKDLRQERDSLATEKRNHIRDMKKCQETRANLNRRFHQLSKKNAELSENEYVLT